MELENDPTVVACVVFQTRDPEQMVELLRRALTGIAGQIPGMSQVSPITSLQRDASDSWLKHEEAAAYLGISRSTLYHYASRQMIECRKLGGRLEYRRSTLDEFKQRLIRPAQCMSSKRGRIPVAPGSGK